MILDGKTRSVRKKHEKASEIHHKNLTIFSGRSMGERFEGIELEEKISGEEICEAEWILYIQAEKSGKTLGARVLIFGKRVGGAAGRNRKPQIAKGQNPKVRSFIHSLFTFTKL